MLYALLALLAPAQAEETEPDLTDVVIVWPDKFARWRDTRWMVTAEVVLPIGMAFAMEENRGFRSHAWQIKAVIACDQEHKLSGKRIEVGCQIEDVGLQSTSVDRYKTERDRERVQEVLDNLDARLTGARVQLQVNDRGAVTNLDLEGVNPRNARERYQAETLRLVMARLMYPFHMKIPKSGMTQGHWVEFDSELMSMPTTTGIQGSSMIVHYLNFYRGWMLVQDIGEGTVAVPLPPRLEAPGRAAADESEDGGGVGGPVIGSGSPDGPTIAYRLRMDGVSIYNIDNGVMEERVWSMTGTPTASYLSQLKYWYAGRIQILGKDDKPDVGPTRQISYPGIPIDELPLWLPADPEIAKHLEGLRDLPRPPTKGKPKR